MTRAVYSFLMWLLQPALRYKLARRARAEPGYSEAVEERFGTYTHPSERKHSAQVPSNLIWVHAVSLGETRAAATFIHELRDALPGMRLLLTHGTATGREQGRAMLQSGDIQVWQPWDTPGAVDRFLSHFMPRIGLLMETEIWPNLVHGCQRQGIALCLVNARLSEKSLHKAQRLSWIACPAYQALTAVWAQAQADALRLEQLGAPMRSVMGNFKFDATPDVGQLQQGRAWRQLIDRPVVVLANSREGEELLFIQVLKEKSAAALAGRAQVTSKVVANGVQWMIVPRHPQRFDEVAALCESQGFSVSRRSRWTACPVAADIWLGDTLGEMAVYYALSDLALLGGSFAALGGHNLIEATAGDCPVVMGPHTFNFALAAELAVSAGAAWTVQDMECAVDKVLSLLRAPSDLVSARTAARGFALAHQGAARRTAEAVRVLLLG